MSNSKTLFLINPFSNEGNAMRSWNRAHKQYPGILPQTPVDITKITDVKDYIIKDNPARVVIIGGDGTINIVCQAVLSMKHKPLLAIIPFGFGNALAYCLGVETLEKAVYVLQQGTPITIDVMKTSLKNHPIGVFNISVGFDARIVHLRANNKYIGIRSYVLSAIRGFIEHKKKQLTLIIDDKVHMTIESSSLVIANCPIIGKNFLTSPAAALNDGLLDCTLFSSRYTYITNLRLRGFKHPFYSESGKVHFKASKIAIKGESLIQVDGDPEREDELLSIEVLPKAVTFLRNNDKYITLPALPFKNV
ncbi:MAG: diacylglycerol kinase family protein [Microgenomates group bacterium]